MQTQSVEHMSFSVLRRDGKVVAFDADKIRNAIAMAFLRNADGQPRRAEGLSLSSSQRAKVDRFTDEVVVAVTGRRLPSAAIGVEDIQDQVELVLMRAGEHEVARDYVLFRQRRSAARIGRDTAADRTVVLVRGAERRHLSGSASQGQTPATCL